MMIKKSGFIVGAYPCAPSFHQCEQEMEVSFWQQLAKNPAIRGIEQPCLQDLHPYGDDFLFKSIPDDWAIVVTAVMATMQRRGKEPNFGLASTDEEQRKACIEFYRHIYQKIAKTNDRFKTDKILALEIQSAPSQHAEISSAQLAFEQSLHELSQWDWPCELVIEHCDAFTGIAPKKGFLPIESEIDSAKKFAVDLDIGICINWARSALEGQNITLPLAHTQQTLNADLLSGVIFSGTTLSGSYGHWGDLHAPFAPFNGAKANCPESIMTVDIAKQLLQIAKPENLKFLGIKLLEIDKDASVEHRVAILEDGINALIQATTR